MRSVPLQRRVSVDGPTGGIPQPSPALRNKMEQFRRPIANLQEETDIQARGPADEPWSPHRKKFHQHDLPVRRISGV